MRDLLQDGLGSAYTLERELGGGGMSRVFVAEDTALGRKVVVKVLHPDLAEGLSVERFKREVRLAARLQHPHIVPLLASGELGSGVLYYTMPLVDGESLRARLEREGSVPIPDVIRVLREVAGALAYAHRQRVVHRDVKPENILLAEGGAVVTDFGIAKAIAAARDGDDEQAVRRSATLTSAGTSLGTPAYMAPEQGAGDAVDHRADLYALGVVAYEMLAGAPPFRGRTAQQLFAAHAAQLPDAIERHRPATPPALATLVMCLLEKQPADRPQSADEILRALDAVVTSSPELLTTRAAGPIVTPRAGIKANGWRSRLRDPLVLALACATVAAASAAAWAATRGRGAPATEAKPLMQFESELGHGGSLGSRVGTDVVLTRDGTRIAYVSVGEDGTDRLNTRRLSEPVAVTLPGTEGARAPFFSPDGQWIGFWAAGKLKKVPVEGGSPVVLADATDLLGATWREDGSIIASLSSARVLSSVPSGGGDPTTIADFTKDGSAPRWPQILPGESHVMYTAVHGLDADRATIEVLSLRDSSRKVIVRGGTFGRYLAPGFISYINQGTLFVAPFDLARMDTTGSPVPVLDGVAYASTFGYAQIDISETGTVVYRKAGRAFVVRLDTTGKVTRLVDEPGRYTSPRVSPDGRRLSLSVVDGGLASVVFYELSRGKATRLSNTVPRHSRALWTPDGRYVLMTGPGGIAWIHADSTTPHPLVSGTTIQLHWSFTPNGDRLAYHEMNEATAFDLWTVPITSDSLGLHAGTPQVYLRTRGYEVYPSLSPDGRWIAYASNRSGAWELYVRRFPDDGSEGVQVSNGGARISRWSPDGRELFYVGDDQRIKSVRFTAKDGAFVTDTPRLWTTVRLADTGVLPNYDLAPDGSGVIALVPDSTSAASQSENHVTVILNFFDELRRRLATRPR